MPPKKKQIEKQIAPLTQEAAKLTDKQQAFVLQYVKDWNATQAAIRAGYATSGARQEGHRLLSNADIRAEINTYLADMAVTAERVLAEQAALAYSDIGDFVTIQDGGEE
jgi:phage terminase small subunit